MLKVRGLKKHFPVTKGLFMPRLKGLIRAVDGIDFDIGDGETFGLVGESGCGKTTTAKLILLLEKPSEGSAHFCGDDIFGMKGDRLRRYRGSVQAIFQDPFSSLNPRMKVGSIVAEPLLVNKAVSRKEADARVRELLDQVELGARAADLYPHEFSGGQRQRIALAHALALNPKLVVLDEPVSALDVSVRAQIMNLLKELQERLALAYLLIAHNLATVRYMSRQVGVMYMGKIIELADSEDLYTHPLHPYTQALLAAALPSGTNQEQLLVSAEDSSVFNLPSGCRFHPRCPRTTPVCSEEEPAIKAVSGNHFVACNHF